MTKDLWSEDDYWQATALDAIVGPRPHYAAKTNFGLFCPSCSDPIKLSFVKAEQCEIAIASYPRESEYGQWSAYMAKAMPEAGSHNNTTELAAETQHHSTRLLEMKAQWEREHPNEFASDS